MVVADWIMSTRCPPTGSERANEIHIPVGRPIVLNVTSRDVIHSFWVPALHGKRDLIPGYTSALWFQADRPAGFAASARNSAVYQHANMALYVVADTGSDFKTGSPRSVVLPSNRRRAFSAVGRRVSRATCPQCHAIRGTAAGATFGPDLTHAGSAARRSPPEPCPTRPTICGGWIRNPQDFKPGSKMPPHDLNDGDWTRSSNTLVSSSDEACSPHARARTRSSSRRPGVTGRASTRCSPRSNHKTIGLRYIVTAMRLFLHRGHSRGADAAAADAPGSGICSVRISTTRCSPCTARR